MTAASNALAAGCRALMEAVRTSAADPADAVRMLETIIATPLATVSAAPQVARAQAAAAALMRRAALASLARACATTALTSSTQAIQLRDRVTTLFNAEITLAADAGSRDVYRALRRLRTAVSADLVRRGIDLPALVTVTVAQSEPSLALAWRFYLNARREPGLVARADVVHPLFMPLQFEALEQ